MTYFSPQRRRSRQPAGPARPELGSPLLREAAFLWSGHDGVDLIGGAAPSVQGNAVPSTSAGSKTWSFLGGGENASNLDFGARRSTGGLALGPATWAFVASLRTLSSFALASQVDNNVDSGWQVAWIDSDFGLEFIASGNNMRTSCATFASSGRVPVAGQQFSVVMTNSGSPTVAACHIYVNGYDEVVTGDDAVGTQGDASGQSLYLGRQHVDTQQSFDGDIALAVMASREWSDAEARSFHENPWQIFSSDPVRTYSFLDPPPADPSSAVLPPPNPLFFQIF